MPGTRQLNFSCARYPRCYLTAGIPCATRVLQNLRGFATEGPLSGSRFSLQNPTHSCNTTVAKLCGRRLSSATVVAGASSHRENVADRIQHPIQHRTSAPLRNLLPPAPLRQSLFSAREFTSAECWPCFSAAVNFLTTELTTTYIEPSISLPTPTFSKIPPYQGAC